MNNLREAQAAMKLRWSRKKRKGPKVGTKQVRRRLTPCERRDLIFQTRMFAAEILYRSRGWTFEQIATLIHATPAEVEFWLTPPSEEWLSSLRNAASELESGSPNTILIGGRTSHE